MAFPTTGVLDNFNRADAPLGASWSQGPLNFAANAGLTIASNVVARGTQASDFRQDSYWNPSTFGPACEVHCKITTVDTVDGQGITLFARFVNIGSGTSDGYGLGVEGDGTNMARWVIQRYTNGAWEANLGAPVTQTVAAGDSVGLESVGSTLNAYHKPAAGSWTLLFSRTDATYAAAGNVGLSMAGTTVRVDDFGGGTLIVPISARVPKGIIIAG
jgi:hypothetical protein